jgi:hypothetical protein
MQGYYSDGTYCYTVGSIGQGVISKTSCTAACVSAGVFNRDPDLTTACSGGGVNTTIYGPSATINIGDQVYRNSTCTLAAIEAYYSNGDIWFQVIAGTVFDKGFCFSP